ncbi:MAG: ATP-binding protein [Oscillospiraceae bacterium]
MDIISENISNIAANTAAANPPQEGDYIGSDGLLYCGKCHTPKQYRLEGALATAVEGGVMGCMCDCEAEAYQAEKERERAELEKLNRELTAHQRKNSCFSDSDYRDMCFNVDKGKSPAAIQAAHYYVENFEKLAPRNMGLMFLGDVGTGKTFAACCIANALIEKGYRALVATASDLIRTVRNPYTEAETFQRIREVDLLVIDDLGTQNNSERDLKLLFDIVDTRKRAKKPLIITSNLSVNELRDDSDYNRHRVYNRIIEMCSCPISPVVLKGNSIRDEIARYKHNTGI